jgi:hypothetical protein
MGRGNPNWIRAARMRRQIERLQLDRRQQPKAPVNARSESAVTTVLVPAVIGAAVGVLAVKGIEWIKRLTVEAMEEARVVAKEVVEGPREDGAVTEEVKEESTAPIRPPVVK